MSFAVLCLIASFVGLTLLRVPIAYAMFCGSIVLPLGQRPGCRPRRRPNDEYAVRTLRPTRRADVHSRGERHECDHDQ